MSQQEVRPPPARGSLRKRIRKACEPCRHRKVKCDGAQPCSLCSGYGYECTYIDSRRGKGANLGRRRASSSRSANTSPVINPVASDMDDAAAGSTSSPVPPRLNVETFEPRKADESVFIGSEEQRPMTASLTTRFTRADSAIAFPRSLGLSLGISIDSKLSGGPPRLHSFAWNTGIRSERLPIPPSKIFTYVTLKDVETYSDIYFTIIHPVFGFLNRTEFNQRVKQCWTVQMIDPSWEAVVCGVIALGSLFSAVNPFTYETDVIEQARQALDFSFAHSAMTLSLASVAGWILRALYLRSTTRPHLSWMASNIAVNIAEAIGLHQELSDIKITRHTPRVVSETELDLRRRTFWVAVALNRLFAAEYGRTRVRLNNIGCRLPNAKAGDATLAFIHITQLLPVDDTCTPSGAAVQAQPQAPTPLNPNTTQNSAAHLHNSLAKLAASECVSLCQSPPISLFRAEVTFAIYRKLRFLRLSPSPLEIENIMVIIRHALQACSALGADKQPWWTLMSIPFHAVCVLIAINTVETLEMVNEPMEVLRGLVETVYDTHMGREGLRTAEFLVRGAEERKRREVEGLRRGLSVREREKNWERDRDRERLGERTVDSPMNIGTTLSEGLTTTSSASIDGGTGSISGSGPVNKGSDPPMFEWPTDLDLGWSAFLEMTGPEGEDFAMGGVGFNGMNGVNGVNSLNVNGMGNGVGGVEVGGGPIGNGMPSYSGWGYS